MPKARPPKKRLLKFRLLEEIYDRRDPSRCGRFNGWIDGGLSGFFAVAIQPGNGRRILIGARYVTSRWREEVGQRLAAGRLNRRLKQSGKKFRLKEKAAADVELHRDIAVRAAGFGLTVEQYLDAVL